MLNIYDLYDLYKIFVIIRHMPDYKLNDKILLKVISVFDNRHDNHEEYNQFRIALSTIDSLEYEELYKFSYTENVYTYHPSSLKNESVYNVLIESCKCLLEAVVERNNDKVRDLADCLHNLPTDIVENNLMIPKKFWKNEVMYYLNKWDKTFLIKEQKLLKEMKLTRRWF